MPDVEGRANPAITDDPESATFVDPCSGCRGDHMSARDMDGDGIVVGTTRVDGDGGVNQIKHDTNGDGIIDVAEYPSGCSLSPSLSGGPLQTLSSSALRSAGSSGETTWNRLCGRERGREENNATRPAFSSIVNAHPGPELAVTIPPGPNQDERLQRRSPGTGSAMRRPRAAVTIRAADIQQRRLVGSVGADHRSYFAGAQFQINPVQGHAASFVNLGALLQPEHHLTAGAALARHYAQPD